MKKLIILFAIISTFNFQLSTLHAQSGCSTPMATPITEGFDTWGHGANVLPDCWVKVANFDDGRELIQITDNPTYGGSTGALQMYCGTNNAPLHYGIVFTPVLSADINTLYLRFKMRGSSNSDRLEIGTASDTLNSSFVPFDTITITNYSNWEDVIVDFSSYTGTGNRIAFRMIRNLQPYNNQRIYVDGIVIEECGVWNMSMLRRGVDDVWLTWDTVGNPVVNIEYGLTGFAAGSGTTIQGAVIPQHVTELAPATTYDFNFYSLCGGGAPHFSGTLTLTTLARNSLTLNYCEGFEETGMPSGWYTPVTYYGTPETSTSESYMGARSLRMRSYYGSVQPIAVMPRIDTVPLSQISLSMMVKGSSSSKLIVGVMEYPEDDSTFVAVDTISVTSLWKNATVSLATYQGAGHYIALKATDDYTNNIYIDNLQVGSCMLSNVGVTNIGSNSVVLQWDTVGAAFHGDSVVVEYGFNGFVNGTRVVLPVRGDGINIVDGKQRYAINGLESDTIYQFAVYGQCSVQSEVCNQFRLSAHTLAESITLPYCVDFEQFDVGGYPQGWERASSYNGYPKVADNSAHSGSRSMRLYSGSSSPNSHCTMVLPMINVDNLNGMKLSLWANKETSYQIVLEVGVMTSPLDESTLTVVDSIVLQGTGWRQYVADLASYSGMGLYIAIRQCGNYWYDTWIDDIEVGSCVVKNVHTRSENSHGVTIEWEGSGTTYTGATLEFGSHGFIRGTGTTVSLDANTFSITIDTLTMGTTYDYYLTSTCSDQQHSCQFEPRTFTTFAQPYVATVCENFNSTDNYSLPDSWTKILADNDRPYVYDHLLQMYSNNTGSLCAMPYLEEDDFSELKLRASIYGHCNNLYVLLGMMSNPLDTNTFVVIDTLHAGNYSWLEQSVSLASYTGTGHHLAFWMKKGQGWCQVNIDNITIERCGLTDIRAYSPTTDAVMIGWNADANTQSVDLYWRRADLPADSNIVVPNVVLPFRLENLDPGTEYIYTLIPHCSSSSNMCSNVEQSFTTMQSTLGEGWCENFESSEYYGELPAHWTKVRRYNSYYPGLDYNYNSTYPSDGIWMMRFRANSATSNMVSLPWCGDTLSKFVLSLNIRSDNEYHPEAASLIVGVMTLPYDSASFVPIDTIHPTFTYRNVSVDFSSYSGEGRHIAFLFHDVNDNTTYVDELSLSRCKAANMSADMITNHSVRLQWNNIGYIGETMVGWKKNENQNENDTMQYQMCSGTSVVIDNLEQSTRYIFYAWASCQDSALQCQASRVEVTTLSMPMAIPYCNDMESEVNDAMPAGWMRPYGNSYPRVYDYSYYAHSGRKSLRFYASSNDNSMAVMPMLDPDSVPSLSSVVVDFWLRGWNDRLCMVVGVMTNPSDTSSFVAVDSLYANGLRHFKVPLTTYTGTGRYIAFKAVAPSNSWGDFYLDDVDLRTCYIGSAHSHRPMQHSIDVSWTGGNASNGVFIEYKAVSGPNVEFASGSGIIIHTTQNPYTISNLNSATWYAVHVYPDCGGTNDGCNYEYTSMQTLHPSVDVPYCDNFDSYSTSNDGFPDNWLRLSTYDSTYNPSIYQYQSHSSPFSCRFRASDTNYAFVVMPQLYMGDACSVVDSLYLNFWTRYYYGRSTGRLVVGTMQDIYDASSFVVVDTLVDTIDEWQHHTVAIHNLNTTNTYVAFKFVNVGHSSSDMFLDDICVEKCVATDVTISDVSQSSVTITWNSNGVDSIMCEYGPQGFIAGTGTQVMMTHTPWVINGLDDGTDYQFAFAPLCGCDQYGEVYFPGGGSSGWNYWGYGWGWGYWGPGGSWGWGWGWWGGRSWWEIPPGRPYVIPPAIEAETMGPDMVVPYCESFEDYDTLLYPFSWRRLNNASSQFPQITDGNHLTGSHCLDFYTTPGHYCYATMPSVDSGSITDMVLTFNAYSVDYRAIGYYSRSNNPFQIGVMNHPDDISTFVPVDTIHLSSEHRWQSFTVDFANYIGDGRYIALRFMPTGQAYHYYIDDLYVGRCAIENLNYNTLPTGEVSVHWNNVHTPDSIIVQYGSQQTTLPGSSQNFLISTLNTQLSTVYVTPYCDTTDICTPYIIDVNPTVTMPYCEDFESYLQNAYPDHWRTKNSTGYYSPIIETVDGANMFRLSSSSTPTMLLLDPLPGGDSLNGKWVNVKLRSDGHDNISLDFGVLTDTINLSSFVSMNSSSVRNSADNTLEEFNVQLTGYSGVANRLAVKVNSTYYYSRIWIDRMVISSEPYPMGVRDGEEGYATRHLYWDSGAYYTLEYYYTESDIRILQSDSCHAMLTGLRPGKEYKVFFVTSNGEHFCQPYTFTTPSVLSLPFCEDFQAYSYYDVPEGWRRINDGGNYCNSNGNERPRVWADGSSSDHNRFLDFYHSCQQIFVMPELNVADLSSLSIRLKARTDDYQNCFMRVGIMSDPADSSTFVDVDTIYCSSNSNYWENMIISLSKYSGNGHYIAFQSHLPDWRYFYLDNIEIYTCPQPEFIIAGSHAVKANVNADSDFVADYWIEYGPQDFDQGRGVSLHVQSNPFFIDGLQPETVYDFYVRCDSTDYSCASPVRITTAPLLEVPYCEDFVYSDNEFNRSWSRYCEYSSGNPYVNGSNELYFYTNRPMDCYAIMPDLAVDSISQLELYFDMYNYSLESAIVVGVMDDRNDISTFVPVDTVYNTATSTWQNHHVSLSGYRGMGRFVALCELTNGNYQSIYLKTLRVQACPHTRVTLASATTVRVAVDSNRQSDMWVEYGFHGFVQGSGDATLVHVTQQEFDIEGLENDSTYDFYVRCDSATVTCMPPVSITTLPVIELPYCEDFDSLSNGTYLPGWQRFATGGGDYPYIYDYSYYSNSGSNSLRFYMGGRQSVYAIMPDLAVDSVRNVDVYFAMRVENRDYNTMVVGVCDDPYDVSTFVAVDTLRNRCSSVYEQHHVSLYGYQGRGRFVTLRGMNSYNYSRDIYIDDLVVEQCQQPEIHLTSATTVTLSVDSMHEADYWLEFGPEGYVQGSGVAMHVTESPYLIANLQPNSVYDFYTRCDSSVLSCHPVKQVRTSSTVALPYCEPFNYSGVSYRQPEGWVRYNSNSNSNYPYVSSSNYMYFSASSDDVCQISLPEADSIEVAELSITFNQRNSYIDDLAMVVGVSIDPNDPSTFTPVDTLRNSVSGDWQQMHVSFANYQGNGRFITLRMYNSYSYSRSMYVDNLFVERCDLPQNVRATLYSHNTVRITADTLATATGFWVEYDTTGFVQGTGHMLRCSSLPMDIQLDNYSTYDLYFLCDTAASTCRQFQTVTTTGQPIAIPFCENFDNTQNNQVPTAWKALNASNVKVNTGNSNSGNKKLSLYTNSSTHYYAVLPEFDVDSVSHLAISFYLRASNSNGIGLTLGVMSDPNDANSFIPVKSFVADQDYKRCIVALDGVASDSRFVAFRSDGNGSYGNLYVDDVFVDSCGVHGFAASQTESNYISLRWNQVGNPDIQIEYGVSGFSRGDGTIVTPDRTPYTIVGLEPLTNYTFYFDAVCNENAEGNFCNLNYHDSVSRFTPAGGTGCIDPTNLTADYTICTWGSYGNPYAHEEVLDFGSESINSRHTVHHDATATDPRTGGQLQMVPFGSDASVRLGNWNYGGAGAAQGESITYSLFVDTNSFDLILLKYAAVLQDPDHDPSEQPRFSLELLNDSMQLLDANCGAADFIANSNLGWNTAAANVLWKDWTTVGVDVSRYGGQTVYIRLTTRDCGEGSHYGYAYFTLECMLKNMKSELCGDVDSNRFIAPSGFAYRWYNEDNLSDTISTEQSLVVRNDFKTYFCDCSFVDKDSCMFTLSSFAGTRYPLAGFTYTVEQRDCKFYVTFIDTSTVYSYNATGDTVFTGEQCETALWDFGNGEQASTHNATVVYDRPGNYTVLLLAGIAGNQCTDSAQLSIDLQRNANYATLSGPNQMCMGDTVTLIWSPGVANDTNYTPNPQLIVSDTSFVVHDSTILINDTTFFNYNVNFIENENSQFYNSTINNQQLYIVYTDISGCPDTMNHSLSVNPVYDIHDTAVICDNSLPYEWRGLLITEDSLQENQPFLFSSSFASVNNCDSTLTLHLTVNATDSVIVYDTVVQNNLPYTYADSSFYIYSFVHGDDVHEILHSTNLAGCDSATYYHLHLWRNVTTRQFDSICVDELPYQWANTRFDSSDFDFTVFGSHTAVKYDTLLTVNGADSLLTMSLTIYPVYDSTDYVTICENALPYQWRGILITEDSLQGYNSTIQQFNNSTFNCDSIHRLELTVDTNTVSHLHQSIVQNQLPFNWNGITFDTVIAGDTATQSQPILLADSVVLVNSKGCDSVVYMSVTVYGNIEVTDDSTICQDALPIEWNGVLFSLADTIQVHGDTSYIMHTANLQTVVGSDSVVLMRLYLNSLSYTTVDTAIVQNELPFLWNDSVYNTPDVVYHDSVFTLTDTIVLANMKGCDSIVALNLTVYLNRTTSLDSAICWSSAPFEWMDSSYYFPYVDTTTISTLNSRLSTIHGADSLLIMTVTVHPVFDIHDTAVTCINQMPFVWQDSSYSFHDADTTQFLVLSSQFSTIHGCDSIITLHLTVGATYLFPDSAVICADAQPYLWMDSSYTFPYADTTQLSTLNSQLSTLYGCDSTYTRYLTVHPVFDIHDTAVTCTNQMPFVWQDSSYYFPQSDSTQFSVLSSQFTTIHGCDSTMTLHLTIGAIYLIHDTAVTCDNQMPFIWQDSSYTFLQSDTTQFSVLSSQFSTVYGCDSILTLHLTVGTTYLFPDSAVICADAQPYLWMDSSYTFPYADTTQFSTLNSQLSTVYECDSVYSRYLTIHPVFDIHDTVVICENSIPYQWRGMEITEDSLQGYITTIQQFSNSTFNCDSTMTLHLTVDTNTHSVVNETIVENQLPYTYHQLVITADSFETGSLSSQFSTLSSQLTILNSKGCDSIVNYSLSVYWNVSTQVSQSICDDQLPYTWNGVTFTESGTQSATLATSHGADSVVVMTLVVNPTYDIQEQAHICFDALPYTWEGITITEDSLHGNISTFNSQFSTIHGCDSLRTLQLTVSDVYQTIDHQESCNPIVWINGTTYSTDIYGPQVTLQSQAGCDSVVILDFHISEAAQTFLTDSFCANSSYFFGGQERFMSGTYVDSLHTIQGCDSIVSLDLTRLELPTIDITVEPDCDLHLYGVNVETNVSYHQWTCEGSNWNNDWGPRTSNQIWVNPALATTWTVKCDYYEQETCPNSKSITLEPLKVPVAQMSITPDHLNYDNDHFYALDQSINSITRMWWVDDDFYGDDQQIVCTPPSDVDTVLVTLVAQSEYCLDTAYQIVPIFRTTVYAPNAFTPDETSNREFSIAMDGVVDYELWIYNRAGVLMFHSVNPEAAWDGTFEGHPCPQGNYVWILKYTSEEKPRQPETKRGSVLLLR